MKQLSNRSGLLLLLLLAFFSVGSTATSFAQGNVQPVDLATYDRLLCVKFENDLPVYVENGRLTDRGAGILSSLAGVLGAGVYSKLVDLDEAVLDEMRVNAQRFWDAEGAKDPELKPGVIADMNCYFVLHLYDSADKDEVIRQLKSSKLIEYVSMMPKPVAPPTPGNYVSDQKYLNTDLGINANQVYSTYNNRGLGVRIVDIEGAFNSSHLDLPHIPLIIGTYFNNTYGNNHGTAVLGELVSKNDGKGTTGIASAATPLFAGDKDVYGYFNVPNAISRAVTATSPGDVLLLEEQTAGPYFGSNCFNSPDCGYVPVEYYKANYDAIKIAVGNNRIVVEAAANGYQNLDEPNNFKGYENHYPFTAANNSGAIIVGAGCSPNGTSTVRSRLGFSNYGSRVDVQAFGEKVMTTGYGDKHSTDGVNYYYTAVFSGTSSASPIVAGACLLIQSVYKSQFNGSYLSPLQMRSLLINTGQAQQSGDYPTSQKIGPLPNAYAAIQSALGASACNAPTSAQLSTSSITASSVRLNCSVSGVQAYGWRYRKVGVTSWTESPTGTNNYFDVTGLTTNTTYEYSAKVRCGATVWSSWSSVKTFTTSSVATCNAPTTAQLSTSSLTTSSVRLNCAVTGVQAYDFRYRKVGVSTWTDLTGSTSNYCDVSGLTANTQYEFSATVRCTATQWSSWSSVKTFTTSSVATCDAPPTSQLSASSITATAARLNCSTSGMQAYDFRYRKVGVTSWTDLPGGSSNYYDVSGLTSSTQYEFSVGVRCTSTLWSSWSASKTFTTQAGSSSNDTPCSATQLSVGSSCSYTSGTNAGATASSSGTTCGTTAPKDVWFKCAIPSSGIVTFRTSAGSLTDAVMAVYWGTSCSSLTYITCEDDNNNGNGSNMPVIGITGQAGTMLWVRVWGYSNATGSFSICAMNYSTSNLTDGGDGEAEGTMYTIDPQAANDRTFTEAIPATKVSDIFPNPAGEQALLPYTLATRGAVQITMCDALGRVVQTQTLDQESGEYQTALDVSALNAGSYYVRFQSGDMVRVQTLQIVR